MQKVLIIDDDPDILETMLSLLDDQGFELTAADHAKKALELISGQTFDLIISDISMPHLSGLDFLKELRKIHPFTPVIFVSGHELTSDMKISLEKDHADFVSKPFDIDMMIQKIQSILQKKQGSSTAKAA